MRTEPGSHLRTRGCSAENTEEMLSAIFWDNSVNGQTSFPVPTVEESPGRRDRGAHSRPLASCWVLSVGGARGEARYVAALLCLMQELPGGHTHVYR